jgi:RHS repeat-associated protein
VTKENNTVHISGLGVPGMKVAADVPPPGLAADAAYQDRFWSTEITLDNTASPARADITLWFAKAVSANFDYIDVSGTTAFMPKSPEIMQYDADGNLIGDGKWSYTYDALNRLVAMETFAVGAGSVQDVLLSIEQGVPPQRLEFAYDYLGRRVQKTFYYLNSEFSLPGESRLRPGGVTRYLYQGWNMITEFEAVRNTSTSTFNLNWKRSFHYGLDIAGTLAETEGVGALLMIQDGDNQYYPAYDGNGNVTGLLGNNGNAVAGYEYTPFGELLRKEVQHGVRNPFMWSTKYTDAETGLVYYGLRYYSPRMGRFINQDPLGELGGLNTYAFTANNPVNGVDMLGLCLNSNISYCGSCIECLETFASAPPEGYERQEDGSLLGYFGDGEYHLTGIHIRPDGTVAINHSNGGGWYEAGYWGNLGSTSDGYGYARDFYSSLGLDVEENSRYAPDSAGFGVSMVNSGGSSILTSGSIINSGVTLSPNNTGVNINWIRSPSITSTITHSFRGDAYFTSTSGPGVYVQRIEMFTNATNASGNPARLLAQSATAPYYEAWPALSGTSSVDTFRRGGFLSVESGSYGIKGELQFYPNADLSRDFPELQPWNVNHAGGLHSSWTTPNNWTSQGALRHEIIIIINNSTSTISTSP